MPPRNNIVVGVIVIAVFFGVGIILWKNEDPQKMYKPMSAENIANIDIAELKQKILSGTAQLLRNNNEFLIVEISAFIKEYEKRVPNDKEVEVANDSLVEKYGPCWGIPEGDCRE